MTELTYVIMYGTLFSIAFIIATLITCILFPETLNEILKDMVK